MHARAAYSEAILDPEGMFHALPWDFDWKLLAEMVLAMLVERERLAETTWKALLNWQHSVLSADASSGAAHGDRQGLHRLVCYLRKPVLSLGRMEYAPGAWSVIYHGKNEAAAG